MKHWMILLKTPIFIRFKNVGNLSLFRGNKNILWYENFNWNHANALLWFILVTRTWLSIVIWCYAAEAIWAVWRFLHVVDNDTLFDKETDKLANDWSKKKPVCKSNAWRIPFCGRANHSQQNKAKESAPVQSKETSKFGKEETIDPNTKVYTNARLLLQSFARVCLNIVTTNCSWAICSLLLLCFTSLQKWGF